jgi:hypothetical protein
MYSFDIRLISDICRISNLYSYSKLSISRFIFKKIIRIQIHIKKIYNRYRYDRIIMPTYPVRLHSTGRPLVFFFFGRPLVDTLGGTISILHSGMTARTGVYFFCLSVVKIVDDHYWDLAARKIHISPLFLRIIVRSMTYIIA